MFKNLAVALAAMALSACGSGSDSGITSGNNAPAQFQGTYTLQGTVMDALTGAHLGGGDLKLMLVQGAEVRSPDRLVTDAKDPLVGEFAFKNIPLDFNNGNKTFEVVAIKDGYLRFEGEIKFTASAGSTIDSVYNKIGNIYLFPVGTTAPPYQVRVAYDGKPVPGAQVALEVAAPDDAADAKTAVGSFIQASPGYLAAPTGTTDSSGTVTFPGASLALGVHYRPVVSPVTFEGVQLALTTGTTFVEGVADAMQTVALGDAAPGGNPYGLYIVSASNTAAGQLDGTGTLTLVFSRAVTLNVPPTGQAFTVPSKTSSGTLDATQPVLYGLSPDGKTLTLQPHWATPPSTNDRGTSITYGNGAATVSVAGYPAQGFLVFGVGGLPLASGGVDSGIVFLTAP